MGILQKVVAFHEINLCFLTHNESSLISWSIILEFSTLINNPKSSDSILHLHSVQATMTKCILR